MEDLKFRLEPQAFEKLKEVVKQETAFSTLTAENIEKKKDAYRLLITWLEKVYELDHKEVIDDDGEAIDRLFKEVRKG